jgi:multiple sugar transport system permease protein
MFMSTTTERPSRVSLRPTRAQSRRIGGAGAAIWPYILIVPAVAYLVIMLLIPLGQGIILSFTDTKLINPSGGRFIGVDNYSRLATQAKFWQSVGTTLIYTALTVIFGVGLGTATALGLNRPFRGRTMMRSLITLPWALPTVATALVFSWMFNLSNGVVNSATGALGIGEVGWLTDPKWGLFSVTIASVWAVFPLVMLVVLASLQSIPGELYEAASLDGAGTWHAFGAVTWPHITPTVQIMALLMTIWSIRRFEIIYLLTGGGPNNATTTIVVNVYREAFQDEQLGRAAAIGVVGLALSLIVTVVYVLADRRRLRKEG